MSENGKMTIARKDYLLWGGLLLLIVLASYFLMSSPNIPGPGEFGPLNKTNTSGVILTPEFVTVSAVSIKAENCELCKGDEKMIQILKNASYYSDLRIGDELTLDYSSKEAQDYISKYNLTVFPTLILSKEANQSPIFMKVMDAPKSLRDWSMESDGVFVLRNPPAPYQSRGEMYGIVEGIEIGSSQCPACTDYNQIYKFFNLKQLYYTIQKYNDTDQEAKELIAKYNITQIPVLLINKSIEKNEQDFGYFNDSYGEYFDLQGDYYIFRNIPPPYFDLIENRIREGMVSLVELSDRYCTDCYAVAAHQLLLEDVGLFFINIEQYDINDMDGFEIIREYGINKFPTVLLSEDAMDYARIRDSWHRLGTEEADGWLVFRNMTQIKTTNYTYLPGPTFTHFAVNTSSPLTVSIGNRTATHVVGPFTATTPNTYVLTIVSADNATISRTISGMTDINVVYQEGIYILN
ncbi:MAG: hypothetical protein ABII22_01525 [Candidatus Micrarchaeota archaeon]